MGGLRRLAKVSSLQAGPFCDRLPSRSTMGLALAVASAAALLSQAAGVAHAAVPFGTNGGAVDFVDLAKQAPWNNTAPLDANGWPLGDNSINLLDVRHNMPWNGPDPTAINADISGTYRISFVGQAVLEASTEWGTGAVIRNQVYQASTNTTTAELVLSPSYYLLVLSLSQTKRLPTDAPGTGFRDLRVIRPGYSPSSGQVFTTSTLNAYANPFTSIRFLESDGANDYAAFCADDPTRLTRARWANRVHVTDAFQGGLPAANTGCNQAHGYAWEYMVMLANAGHHDMWINVPVDADDDYVFQLAQLLRRGNAFTRGLDPDLHVYVEYSNEVWNDGFPQQQYNLAVAQQEGISQIQRYVERTIQIAKIFRNEFGSGSLNQRVRAVALWQYTTELTMQAALRWAETRFQQKVRDLLWGIGEAPYYDPTDVSTVNNILDTLWTGSDKVRTDFIGWQAVATFFGLKQVGYESGPGLYAYPLYATGVPTADRDPRMRPIMVHHFLDNWFAVGGDLVNFYSMRGKVSPFGDYFLFEDENILWRDSPKLAAAQDIMRATPPAISAGYLLPWTAGASTSIDPSQHVPFPFTDLNAPGSAVTIAPLGTNDPDVNTYDYLLRSTGGGSYNLTFFGHSEAAGAELQVHVDNALKGTVRLPQGQDGLSAPVRIDVGPGFHTLSLVGGGTAKTIFPATTGAIRIQSIAAAGEAARPSAPHNLSARPVNARQIALTWAPSTMATGYVVKRSCGSGGPYEVVGRPATNVFTDDGVRDETTYYYVVAATNAAGESALSPQVPAVATRPRAPDAPTGVRVVRADAIYNLSEGGNGFLAGGEILISWNPASDATSYTITRTPCLTGVEEGPCPIATQLANKTSYLDIGEVFFPPDPQTGIAYRYSVQANNAFGSSADSAVVSVTPAVGAPDAPTSVTAKIAFGGVLVQWTPPFGMLPNFGPMQYNVYRGTTSSGPFSLVTQISTATFVDKTATAGSTYYYVVTAAKAGAESAQSRAARISL